MQNYNTDAAFGAKICKLYIFARERLNWRIIIKPEEEGPNGVNRQPSNGLKFNRSFSLSRNKKINWKPSSGRSPENEMLQKTNI